MPNPDSVIALTYKGTDLQTLDHRIFLEVAEGLSNLPELRGDDYRVGGRPGADVRVRLPDLLGIMLLGWTKNPSWAAYRATILELQRLFRPQAGPGALVATLESGVVVTAQARALALVPSPEDPGPTKRLSVTMEAVDPPYWLGANVTDAARAIAASPTNWTMVHPGTEQTHRATFTFTGPITNPRVTNLENGVYVEWLGSVPGGAVLVIDCLAFTATLDGENVVGSIRHSGAREWMVLLPGDNDLRVTASTPGGTLTTTFEPPYL